MFKKVVIAGLAVVVGVAVVGWICPEVLKLAQQKWDDTTTAINQKAKEDRQAAQDAVPLEKRIKDLRDKVQQLDDNKQKLVDAYGVKATAVKETQDEVDKLEAALAEEMKRIDAFTEDLGDTQKTSFTYGTKVYPRKDVENQLKDEFGRLKSKQGELDAKKDLLEARKAAKDAAWKAVSTFNEQKDDLLAKLDNLEAELQQVRTREAAASAKVSDNDMANLASQIDDLNKKVDEKNNAADAAQALKGGPINPLPEPNADSKDDILKQIRDWKAARNGAPKTPAVADQK